MASFPTSYIPTTSATVTRAADVAQVAGSNFGTTRTNLLVRSEEFDNASWTVFSGAKTVTPNTTVAPNGTLTADTVTADGTSGAAHFVDQTVTLTAIPHAFTVYAKAGTNNFIQLRLSSALGNRHANFNVSTGATGTSGNITSSSVEPVGNGWYRCSMVCTPTAATGTLGIIVVSSNSAISGETNALNTSVILWGAQLETGSAATPYIPSTTTFTSRASGASYFDAAGVLQWKPQNLLVRSEEFDNTGTWSRTGLSTVTANAAVAPDGSTTADALVEDASTSVHRAFAATPSLLASTPHSFSVYVKASVRSIVRVEVRDSAGGFSIQDFDLTTQVITSAGSGTGTISSVGNGWFRCTVNGTSSVSGGVGIVLIYSMQVVGTAAYTGTNGTSAILIWGAQLEQRAGSFTVPGEYTPTVATATGGARNSAFLPDSSGVFRSAGPLLLEEARTNIISNSENFGGAPWSLGEITVTADAAVSPTGATTADSLLETTANMEHTVYVTSPQTFTTATHSLYVKPNGRTNVALRFYYGTDDWVSTVFSLTGNGSVTQSSAGSSSGFSAVSSSIANVGNGWYRISMTGTQTSRGTYGAVLNLCTSSTPTLGTSNGSEVYAGDITKGVYVWGAQLEAASTASSYIPTTGSTVTRAADVSTSTATSVFESSWYNQTEGTVFTEYAGRNGGRAFMADDGTGDNRFEVRISSATSQLSSWSAGTQVVSGLFAPAATGLVDGVLVKTAVGLKVNDAAISTNGAAVGTDTSCAMPVALNRMILGSFQGSGTFLNGPIKRLTFWPPRLSNEVLQRITQP